MTGFGLTTYGKADQAAALPESLRANSDTSSLIGSDPDLSSEDDDGRSSSAEDECERVSTRSYATKRTDIAALPYA